MMNIAMLQGIIKRKKKKRNRAKEMDGVGVFGICIITILSVQYWSVGTITKCLKLSVFIDLIILYQWHVWDSIFALLD